MHSGEYTCHNCGDLFRRENQYVFFCNNTCRAQKAIDLGLRPDELLNEIVDDLALVMYGEYIMEINDTRNQGLVVG
jgi:hypothetical protein